MTGNRPAGSTSGKVRKLLFQVLLLVLLLPPVDCLLIRSAAFTPKMRPYAGIGLLLTSAGEDSSEAPELLQLYEEPALSRLDTVNPGNTLRHEWVRKPNPQNVALIVMNRKGNWFRVTYDDAGREGWLLPSRKWSFRSWDEFLKGRSVRLLPGLAKRYYQYYPQRGASGIPLLQEQNLKVLRLENDWAMVMLDQQSLGWVRWRDEDGRLLVGLEFL